MSSDPYSQRVRALFDEPQHAGRADGPYVVVEDQGVSVALSAHISGERVTMLRFQAWGCPHLIAAAEVFCAEYEGLDLAAWDDFSASAQMRNLPVPVEKTGRILVLEDAVQSLGAKCREALKN